MEEQGIVRLRKLNHQQDVEEGELVWQGKLGYCVLKESASRGEYRNVEVLMVQSGPTGVEGTILRSDLLNPVRGLALSGAVVEADRAGQLVQFLDSLKRGISDEAYERPVGMDTATKNLED